MPGGVDRASTNDERMARSLNGGAPSSFATIVPADGADLPNGVCDGIHCGAAGNVTVIGENDQNNEPVTFAVTACFYLSGRFRRVLAAGTTVPAGSLIALYY